jgi:hypothetical protein
VELYFHSTIRLHGVVLNYLGTGTLPFTLSTIPEGDTKFTKKFVKDSSVIQTVMEAGGHISRMLSGSHNHTGKFDL